MMRVRTGCPAIACLRAIGAERGNFMRVLMVEDDDVVARSLELMLKSEGFTVLSASLGEDAIDLVKHYDHDIIILDLGLPDMTGFDVLRSLRRAKVGTPVLVLSGDSEVQSRVAAFSLGADDYLIKPFHKDELVARLRAVIRRSRSHAQATITTGKITVNLDTKTVEGTGGTINLTTKEYQLLELLSLRRGATMTKEMILNHLYGGLDEPEPKIVDVFVCKLRKKLADATDGEQYIQTIWGRGYTLKEQAGVAGTA